LGITPNQQMDMVWHDFNLDKLLFSAFNTFLNEHFQPLIDPIHEDLTPIRADKTPHESGNCTYYFDCF
jgi:hypothetical protein